MKKITLLDVSDDRKDTISFESGVVWVRARIIRDGNMTVVNISPAQAKALGRLLPRLDGKDHVGALPKGVMVE
jgi:hypothetical protein